MSRNVWAHSRAQKIVNAMKVGEIETPRAIADRLGLAVAETREALYQRALQVKDVVKMPEGYIRVTVVEPGEPNTASRSIRVARNAGIAERTRGGGRRNVAAMRTPPEFREWRPALQAGPIRPGADDYRDIPSRYGDQRIRYKGARPVTTTVTGTNVSSGVK